MGIIQMMGHNGRRSGEWKWMHFTNDIFLKDG